MKQWFEEIEQYMIDDPLGERQWPQSLSLVRVHTNEEGEIATTSGWGEKSYVRNYERGKFSPRRILSEYLDEGHPFAIVMRSVPLLAVDIDGKNGGIQASRILRLPPTLAETSKSGTGYHLFYRIPEAQWNPEFGYKEFGDTNGLVPGVDTRGTGVVYHYATQRWNNLDPVPLPNTLRKLLAQRQAAADAERARKTSSLEPEDLAIAQEQTLARLAKHVPVGKRNQNLYAIGCDMQLYRIKDWEQLLETRALMLGLDEREITQLIRHIKKYA